MKLAFHTLSDFSTATALAMSEGSAEPDVPVESREDIHAAAFALGREAGLLEAADVSELERFEHQQRFAAELVLAEQTLVRTIGDKLGDDLSVALAKMQADIGSLVAEVIAPWLSDAVRLKAVSEFQTSVAAAFDAKDLIAATITGPEILIEALQSGEPMGKLTLNTAVSDTVELQINFDRTTIRTQMASAVASLREFAP